MINAPAIARGGRLTDIGISRRYRLVPQGAALSDTLAIAGGEPWIVAGSGYVVLGSPIDPAATSLPLRAAFLPWLAGIFGQRLGAPAGDVGAPITASPGASIVTPPGVDAIESPTGARRSVAGDRITAPAERGVWFFLRAGRRVGAVVVEAPESESDLTRLSADRLASRLGGTRARGVTEPEALARAAFAVGSSHPVTTPLLVVAFLLLAAETIAVRASRPATA